MKKLMILFCLFFVVNITILYAHTCKKCGEETSNRGRFAENAQHLLQNLHNLKIMGRFQL